MRNLLAKREAHHRGVGDTGAAPWLHTDSNWIPFRERFLELPMGKVVLDLDGMTNIAKAMMDTAGNSNPHRAIRVAV